MNEFEYLSKQPDMRIVILEYKSEYLAAGCLKIPQSPPGSPRSYKHTSRTTASSLNSHSTSSFLKPKSRHKLATIVKVEIGDRKQEIVRKKLYSALEQLALHNSCTQIQIHKQKKELQHLLQLGYNPCHTSNPKDLQPPSSTYYK